MPRPPGTPTVDLTASGSSGSIDFGVFQTSDLQPSGTGVFNSFVQIQHNGTEQGYNTDHAPQFDEKSTVTHNHSVLLAAVPIVIGDGSNGTTEGVNYRVFNLDMNAANGTLQYLSLDALQIWQEEAGGLTSFTSGVGFAGAHTNYLAYNLDAGGDHWVGLADRSHGSGQSDISVLIPDSAFVNDAAHRYVTLYSQFGLQSGWASNGGFEEWGTSGPNSGPLSAIAVHKTATVPGGTADVVGEVVSYTIAVDNVGNTALTGLTVTDPYVSDLAAVLSGGFNSGDTNHDGKLSAGETWHYTAHHTVTQADLDNGGNTGEDTISNTVTADTDQTAPVSASASVEVVRNSALHMVKTPDVTSVDAAGQVIHYTITVENTGFSTLTGLVVTDPQVTNSTPIFDFNAPILSTSQIKAQVLDGDYNAGDTNQNGIQDPGETFQYFDTGVFANVGDTNLNGTEDPGETFQYANVGDTNHNGVQDPGETFQFLINHVVAGVDANHDGFNDGDTNHDGNLGVGETWQFAASYTITQADIDNGGVHDNTSSATTDQAATGDASASVLIVQNPHLSVTKTASIPDADGDGKIDSPADDIAYTITVVNDGNMTLTGVSTSDTVVGALTTHTETGGTGTNGDDILDVGETWTYTPVYDVQQADIDNRGNVDGTADYNIHNTASVTTAQGASGSASADVAIDYRPHLVVDKTGTWMDANHDGKIDARRTTIAYNFAVTNDGNVTLTGVKARDTVVGLTTHNKTAADHARRTATTLDVGETWTYTPVYTVQQADIDNHGSVDGTADDNIHESASVTTARAPARHASPRTSRLRPSRSW